MQHILKPPRAAARAQVVAAQLLEQFLVTVHHAHSALYLRLGRIAAAALAGALKRNLAGSSSSSPSSHPPPKSFRSIRTPGPLTASSRVATHDDDAPPPEPAPGSAVNQRDARIQKWA